MLNLRINNGDTSQRGYVSTNTGDFLRGFWSSHFRVSGRPAKVISYEGSLTALTCMCYVYIYIHIYIYILHTHVFIYIYTDMHIDNHRYTIYAYVAMKINPLTYTSLPGDTPSTQTWLPGKSLSSCLMGAMAASRDTHVNQWYVPPPLGCIPWMFFRWFHQVQGGACYEWRQIKNGKKNLSTGPKTKQDF